MLTQTDYTNILLWVDEFFANASVCLNSCCEDNKGLCDAIAKVYALKKNILESVGILSEIQIDNLYRRLQCLIDLYVFAP